MEVADPIVLCVLLLLVGITAELLTKAIRRVFTRREKQLDKEEEKREPGYTIEFMDDLDEKHGLLAQQFAFNDLCTPLMFHIGRLVGPSRSVKEFCNRYGDVLKARANEFTVTFPDGSRVMVLAPLLVTVGVSMAAGDMIVMESISGQYRDTVQLSREEEKHTNEQGVQDG